MEWVPEDDEFFRSTQPCWCPLIGRPVSVVIHTGGRPIQPEQEAVLARFLQLGPEHRPALIRAVYGEGSAGAVVEEMAASEGAGGPVEWPEVRWDEVLVPLHGGNGARFVFLSGRPTWDVEHGVEVLYKDERVRSVGRQEGAFCKSSWQDDYQCG